MNKTKRLALEAIMVMICECKEKLESEPSFNKDVRESIVRFESPIKVARQAGRGKLDNWVDIAGYAACGAEITAEVET